MPAADLYRALWRHRRLIAILTAIAGVAAFVYSSSQPKVYEASALVRIQQRATAAGDTYGSVSSLELGERLAQTYARIVTTRSMATRVARQLPGVPRAEISLSASPVAGVELLEISAQSRGPERAALIANTTAVSLTAFVKETGTLRDQIIVVDRATPPSTPVEPRPLMTVAIAVILALLLNSALALMLEFFSDRLPGVDEFEERFGHPVLATIPSLSLHTARAESRPSEHVPSLPEPPRTERPPSLAPRWDPKQRPGAAALSPTVAEREEERAGGR